MKAEERDRNRIRFPILYQIMLTMLLVALLPLGGLWYISVYDSKLEWDDRVQQSLVEQAGSLGARIEQWTAMNLRALEQNARTPAIEGMSAQAQNPVLLSMTETYPWIYLAFTIQPDGQNLGRSDGKPTTYYGDREYFHQVLQGRDLGMQVLLGKTSRKPALIFAKPILGATSAPKGVIAIAMTLEDLSTTVTKTRVGLTGYAILLDDQNRLIAHGDGQVSSELQDMSAHPALAAATDGDVDRIVFEQGGKRIVAKVTTLDRGWKLIVQQDYDEAYAVANAALKSALVLLGATLVSVVVIALLLAKRLSAPIRHLTSIAEEISRGSLDTEITEVNRSDEIGALARGIERMRVSLRMALDRLRKR